MTHHKHTTKPDCVSLSDTLVGMGYIRDAIGFDTLSVLILLLGVLNDDDDDDDDEEEDDEEVLLLLLSSPMIA